MPDEVVRSYQGISKRTKDLLKRQEGLDGEFKRSLTGLDSTDIVAFANSASGGAILIGVEEVIDKNGLQIGKIVGCNVGDGERLRIINKAENCIPPIDVKIFIENLRIKPFFRVEIDSGKHKPYCTRKGTYTIRGDGRTLALLPERLLSLFIEAEAATFLGRFRDATHEITDTLEEIREQVKNETESIAENVGAMHENIEHSLNAIFSRAENAEELSGDAMSLSDETLGTVNEIYSKADNSEYWIGRIDDKIDVLLKNFGLEDPVIVRVRSIIKEVAKSQLESDPALDINDIANNIFQRFPAPGVTFDDVFKWCKEASQEYKDGHEVR